MKIGIVTYWKSEDNYGQLLQCYALQTYLKNKGHDAYLIKYAPVVERSTNILIRRWIGYVLDLIIPSRKRLAVLLKERLLKNKTREFSKFRKQYISQTDTIYSSIEEIKENYPEADCYITGSDQVWNNDLQLRSTLGWYLDFGDAYTLRISYAASIGRDLKDEEIDIFCKYITNLDGVSVREKSTEILCKKLGLKDVQTVLDPTLLLPISSYNSLMVPLDNINPFIFIYLINVNTIEETKWKEIEPYITKSKLDVRVVSSSGYCNMCDVIPNHSITYATIPEWLSYIQKSEYVVTTSFHGIVFSILMHKPFLAIPLKNEYKQANVRIYDFLSLLHLESRIYNNDLEFERQITQDINWDDVDLELLRLKKPSEKFIEEILKMKKQNGE